MDYILIKNKALPPNISLKLPATNPAVPFLKVEIFSITGFV